MPGGVTASLLARKERKKETACQFLDPKKKETNKTGEIKDYTVNLEESWNGFRNTNKMTGEIAFK